MLWQRTISLIEQEIGAKDTMTWITSLDYQKQDEYITLYAPNRFAYDEVNNKYFTLLKTIILSLANEQQIKISDILLKYEHEPADLSSQPVNTNTIDPAAIKKTSATISHNLNPSYTLDNFIEGRSNQIAHQAAIAISQNPDVVIHNPLFIYGGTGLGKTHLMHGLGNAMLQKKTFIRIAYFSSEVFVRNFVHAIYNKKIEEFKEIYRSLDVLLIDDIQFLANKTGTQEEFFHTFNYLFESNQQIVLSADRYPKEIEGVDSRLKSRLSCGLTVRIEPPELETRVQ
jgi:chromosomal replication initiator protein